MESYNAKERLVKRIEDYLVEIESDTRYYVQLNRVAALDALDTVKGWTRSQAYKAEKEILEAEKPGRFGKSVVNATDIPAFG